MKAGTDSSKVRTECGQQLTGKGCGGIGIDRRRIQTVTVEYARTSPKMDLYIPVNRQASFGWCNIQAKHEHIIPCQEAWPIDTTALAIML